MLGQFEERYGFGLRGVARDALGLLQHAWRGNVRELEAVLEQAAIFAGSEWITLEDLDLTLRSADGRAGRRVGDGPASPTGGWLQRGAALRRRAP